MVHLLKWFKIPCILDSRMEKKKTEHAQPFISIFTAFLRIKKSILNPPCSRLLCVVTARGWRRGKLCCPGGGWTRGGNTEKGSQGPRGEVRASAGRCVTSQSIQRAMQGWEQPWDPSLLGPVAVKSAPPGAHRRARVLSQGLPWRWWDRAAAH